MHVRKRSGEKPRIRSIRKESMDEVGFAAAVLRQEAHALTLMRRRGCSPEEFHRWHPGGSLGRKLLTIREIMYTGEDMPLLADSVLMSDVLVAMTGKGFGVAGIIEKNRLAGIITDGDLRRHMGPALMDKTARQVMHADPVVVSEDTLAVAIYVAGNVPTLGRYAGGPQDSAMSYLDRAGGILPEQGSYRNIKILRGKRIIGRVDLYDYMLRGELPSLRLKDGDTILVEVFGMSVAAFGLLRQAARYEFQGKENLDGKLLTCALPLNGVSHVSVGGIRGKPFHAYVTLDDFRKLKLEDGDQVEFVADTRGKTIMVAASGAIHGASRFPVLKQTRLKTLLEYVAVKPELADIKSFYIRRRSVAAEQKVILADALRRLEQSALAATSSSVDEASIRVKEAELIQNFVQRAAQMEPDGGLVVSREGRISDVLLEKGDEIIIPRKTDVVHVSGEVLIPTAVTWEKGLSLKGYLSGAGGLSDRADKSNILIVSLNGEVSRAEGQAIEPGDHILVMPKFDSKNLQLVKDVTQVLYQMAVAVKVAVGL